MRASVRALTKKPGFTVLVVLSLTVGSADDTAIFSVVNGVLMRPLPSHHSASTVASLAIWQRPTPHWLEDGGEKPSLRQD